MFYVSASHTEGHVYIVATLGDKCKHDVVIMVTLWRHIGDKCYHGNIMATNLRHFFDHFLQTAGIHYKAFYNKMTILRQIPRPKMKMCQYQQQYKRKLNASSVNSQPGYRQRTKSTDV